MEEFEMTEISRDPKRSKNLKNQISQAANMTHKLARNYTFSGNLENQRSSIPLIRQRRRTSRYWQRYDCTFNNDPENGNFPIFTIITFALSCFMFYKYNTVGKILDSPWFFKADIKLEFWRYITYAFVHADFVHIFTNLIIFFVSCSLMEMVHGSFVVIGIFVAGIIFGSLLSEFVLPKTYLVGMSGGCYALFCAHISNLVINGDIMNRNLLVLRATILTPLLLLVLKDTYCGWFSYLLKVESCYSNIFEVLCPNTIINYAAHMGGSWTGFTLGICVLRNYEKSTQVFDENTGEYKEKVNFLQYVLRRIGAVLFGISSFLLVLTSIFGWDIVYWLGDKWQNQISYDHKVFCDEIGIF